MKIYNQTYLQLSPVTLFKKHQDTLLFEILELDRLGIEYNETLSRIS